MAVGNRQVNDFTDAVLGLSHGEQCLYLDRADAILIRQMRLVRHIRLERADAAREENDAVVDLSESFE
jgi:hypothetical protein